MVRLVDDDQVWRLVAVQPAGQREHGGHLHLLASVADVARRDHAVGDAEVAQRLGDLLEQLNPMRQDPDRQALGPGRAGHVAEANGLAATGRKDQQLRALAHDEVGTGSLDERALVVAQGDGHLSTPCRDRYRKQRGPGTRSSMPDLASRPSWALTRRRPARFAMTAGSSNLAELMT